MSESKGKGRARRIGRSSDFWILRVDADVLYRLLVRQLHQIFSLRIAHPDFIVSAPRRT